jgi:hypothetical protein
LDHEIKAEALYLSQQIRLSIEETHFPLLFPSQNGNNYYDALKHSASGVCASLVFDFGIQTYLTRIVGINGHSDG